MSSVSRTECVVYVNVAESSEFLREGRIILCFSCVKTYVLKKNCFAVLESGNLCLCVISYNVACESNFSVKQFVESVGNGL